MFEQTLPGNTKKILALLEKSEIIQKAYLAGGTALALQLGHRVGRHQALEAHRRRVDHLDQFLADLGRVAGRNLALADQAVERRTRLGALQSPSLEANHGGDGRITPFIEWIVRDR